MTIPEHYTGDEYQDAATLDALTIAFIDAKLYADERELYETKWWDYRFMHPCKATLIFAHYYKLAVKRALRVRADIYIAANYKGLKEDNLFLNSKTTYTGMWKARQMADRHGVPYDFWCWKAMQYAEERNWHYLPKPQQMYSTKPHAAARPGDPSIVDYICTAWANRAMDRLITASEPSYCVENYAKHPYQRAYQRYLVWRIGGASLRPETIGNLVYEKRHLAAEVVLAAFEDGERLLLRGREFADLSNHNTN